MCGHFLRRPLGFGAIPAVEDGCNGFAMVSSESASPVALAAIFGLDCVSLVGELLAPDWESGEAGIIPSFDETDPNGSAATFGSDLDPLADELVAPDCASDACPETRPSGVSGLANPAG
jgi:hypothetical protein